RTHARQDRARPSTATTMATRALQERSSRLGHRARRRAGRGPAPTMIRPQSRSIQPRFPRTHPRLGPVPYRTFGLGAVSSPSNFLVATTPLTTAVTQAVDGPRMARAWLMIAP